MKRTYSINDMILERRNKMQKFPCYKMDLPVVTCHIPPVSCILALMQEYPLKYVFSSVDTKEQGKELVVGLNCRRV
jgi:hypothetical protein